MDVWPSHTIVQTQEHLSIIKKAHLRDKKIKLTLDVPGGILCLIPHDCVSNQENGLRRTNFDP